MNALFILGNGFDINLGMATRYTDFYSFYKTKKTDSETINNLKKSISTNLETWADLELAFGKYTKYINSVEEFDVIFADIQNHLSEYLQNQEKSFDVSKLNMKIILDHFSNPEKFLVKKYADDIKTFKENWKNHQWIVDVITLNYTKTLEKIIENKSKNIELGKHHNTNIVLREISHIHGYTDNRMILGVNDTSQIGNKNFHKEVDITDTLIKENCNQAQGHTIEVSCKEKIQKANLIYIFGSSLGKTDKLWWDLIIQRLKDDCRLIIFDRDNDISPLRPQFRKRIERNKIRLFLSYSDIELEKKKEIESKIYFGINTEIFKLN